MNLGQLKQLRTTVFMTGLLASAISISACQQQQEPEPSLEDSINAEESVPMSADPADPSDTVVATDDASLNEVEDDTIANVNTDLAQITYLCTPTLKVEATYKDETNQVVVGTDMGTVTLTQTNEGTNPEVFEVDTAMVQQASCVQQARTKRISVLTSVIRPKHWSQYILTLHKKSNVHVAFFAPVLSSLMNKLDKGRTRLISANARGFVLQKPFLSYV
jgi:hypothetical protein